MIEIVEVTSRQQYRAFFNSHLNSTAIVPNGYRP